MYFCARSVPIWGWTFGHRSNKAQTVYPSSQDTDLPPARLTTPALADGPPGAPQDLTGLLAYNADCWPGRGLCFLPQGWGQGQSMTYGQLHQAAQRLALRLRAIAGPHDRALICCPQGLEYVVAFFGAVYAGLLPVPLYPPRLNRQPRLLAAVAEDCRPALVLTTAHILERCAHVAKGIPALAQVPWLAVDTEANTAGSRWRPPATRADDPAFLQYTSGSTGQAKGVVASHGATLAVVNGQLQTCALNHDDVAVSWLPLHHDLGLITALLASLCAGIDFVFMPPMVAWQSPERFLTTLAQVGGTCTFDMPFSLTTYTTILQGETLAGCDLSRWRLAMVGGEIVRRHVLEDFLAAGAGYGIATSAPAPGYGLAESLGAATVTAAGQRFSTFRSRLSAHPVEQAFLQVADEDVVACGQPLPGMTVAIVDARGHVLPSGQPGEIWLAGESVATGYWQRPDETRVTFQAQTADGSGPWLRSGDLGLIANDLLFVTGRIKEILRVRGESLRPHDLEEMAGASHSALRADKAAAFLLPGEGDEAQRIAVAVEVHRTSRRVAHPHQAAVAVDLALSREFGLRAAVVAILPPGSLPFTTSGKLRRLACASLLQDGSWRPLAILRQPFSG